MDHQIKIKSFWTDALSDQVKNDYLSIANTALIGERLPVVELRNKVVDLQ